MKPKFLKDIQTSQWNLNFFKRSKPQNFWYSFEPQMYKSFLDIYKPLKNIQTAQRYLNTQKILF